MKTTLLFLSVFLSASLFGQNVYIPDANFKAYLVGDSEINTNGDTEIQVTEATAFDGTLDCQYQNISDLTGFEALTAITELNCSYNQLTTIDVSQNTSLEFLECGYNQLTSLDVSQNTVLEELQCLSNQLISLNLNGADALAELDCRSNQLTNLDLSQNIALTTLYCGDGNAIISLDVSQNTALTTLDCEGLSLTSLDVSQNTALTNLECNVTLITSLDVSQNNALEYLNCSESFLTCLNVRNGNNENLVLINEENQVVLSCIQVDNVMQAEDFIENLQWVVSNEEVNSPISFSEDCGTDCSGCISTSSTDIHVACDSYTWIDGNTYTSSNNSATFLTTNSAGCDSVITLDLTINAASIGTDVQEICSGDEYTWIDGNIYTEPNDSSTYTMVGNNGCDSIVTLNLSVISVPEPTIMQNGNTLSCDNFATAYQWLDCDDNYAPIEGATDMVFTATQNGSYALEITFIECSDTSGCYTIDFVGISELNSTPKQIVKIIDLMGRETSFKPNTPLIYVYDDGSVEKVFSVEY